MRAAAVLLALSVMTLGNTAPLYAADPADPHVAASATAAAVTWTPSATTVEMPGDDLDAPRLERAAAAGRLGELLREASLGTAAGGAYSPVHDLDGDGHDDLLHVAHPVEMGVDAGALRTVRYTALKGTDRSTLWTMEVPGQVGAPLVVDAGPDALVLATVSSARGAAGQHTEVRLRGVSNGGAQRWEQSVSGVMAVAPTGYVFAGYPMLTDPIDLAGGHQAVLISRMSYAPGAPQGSPDSAEAVVIDAVTGSVLGRPAATGRGQPWAWPAGDLDGDGNGDVLLSLAEASRGGAPGDLHAFTTDGTALWSVTDTPAVAGDTWIEAAGDTDGDGHRDVAVGNGIMPPFLDRTSHGVFILDGRTGRTLTSRQGNWPTAVGDLDGDGRTEVVARTIDMDWDAGAVFRIQHEAFDGRGVTRYSVREERILGEFERERGAYASVPLRSTDLDADGVKDPVAEGVTFVDAEEEEFSGAFSGRTGRRLWLGPVGDDLGASVSGGGNDLAIVEAAGKQITVTAQDGATGATLWTTDVPLDLPAAYEGRDYQATVRAGDVNGDGVRDMTVTVLCLEEVPVRMAHRRSVVLSGVDGTPL